MLITSKDVINRLMRLEILILIKYYLLASDCKIGSPSELISPAPNVIITSPLFAIFVISETTSSIEGFKLNLALIHIARDHQ